MFRRAMTLFIAFAILVGGTGLPTVAHAHGGATVHALELLDHHDETPQPVDGDRSAPDHSAHHHCGSTLGVHAAALPLTFASNPAALFAGLVAPLASLSRAPLTEPPSA